VEKRGGGEREKKIEGEIESNAEAEGAEDSQRRERIDAEGTEIGAQRSRRILGSEELRKSAEKIEIARVIYSAAKIAYWSCLLG
jgi:hypothetical protein